jgi:hypothetical protein
MGSVGMKLIRRLWTSLQARWAVVPMILGVTGVFLGWRGFSLFQPDDSAIDHIYMSLQLLVLEGPSGGSGSLSELPWELSAARLVCAAVPGSTLLFLALRTLTNRVDRLVGLLARNHIVIIGDTLEACQLAVVEATSQPAHRASKRRVILIGTVEPMLENDMRARGIVVTSESRGKVLQRLLRGSAEIVIMENSDSVGLRRFREIRDLMSDESDSHSGTRPAIRLVVASTELARMQRSYEEFRPDSGCTVISAAEAVAEKITSIDHFPLLMGGQDDHIIVVGEGEYAMQVAMLAFHRRFVPGRSLRLDLVAGLHDTWQHDVAAELPDSFTASVDAEQLFQVHHPRAQRAEYISGLISDLCCLGNDQHQIFIVGLPDERAFPIAHEVATRLPQSTVLCLLQEDFGSAHEFEELETERGKLHVVRVGEVLAEIDALRLTVAERLAAQLCDEFRKFSNLPGKLGKSEVVQAFVNLTVADRRKWSQDLARDLLVSLRNCGVVLQQTENRKMHTVGGVALREARSCCSVHVTKLDARIKPDSIPNNVFRLVSRLPDLLGRFGVYIRDESGDSTTLSDDEIEGMAREIHNSYLETIRSSGVDVTTLPHYIEWDSLNEEQREKNRRPARDLESRLLNIGLTIAPHSTAGSRPLHLDPATVEQLAEDEHDAWMLTQLANGYRFGEVREEDRRIHPQMVAYEDLVDTERQKDRDAVRQMGRLLESIGWGVVPQPN